MATQAKAAAAGTAVATTNAQQPIRLYELAAEYREVALKLENMELDEQTIKDTLEGMAGALELKATNVAMVIRNFEATAAMIKKAEEGMAKRRKAYENRAENMQEYLKTHLESCEIKQIESPYFKLSIRNNNPSVVIDNEKLIPKHMMTVPTMPDPVPIKADIAAALKAEQEAILIFEEAIQAAVQAGDKKLTAKLERELAAFRKTCIKGAHLASSGTRLEIR